MDSSIPESIKARVVRIDEARANLRRIEENAPGTLDHRKADDELHGAIRDAGQNYADDVKILVDMLVMKGGE